MYLDTETVFDHFFQFITVSESNRPRKGVRNGLWIDPGATEVATARNMPENTPRYRAGSDASLSV